MIRSRFAFTVLVISILSLFSPFDALAESKAEVKVLTLKIHGGISPAQDDLLAEALSHSTSNGFDILLIELDTPGGTVSAMRSMVKRMLNSPIPVGVWVGPSGARAASAGVFIVAASTIACMAPQTSIGAASPVSMGGGDIPDTMKKKIRNDIVSLIKGVAQSRNRNVDWYIDSIDLSESATAHEAYVSRVIEFISDSPFDFMVQAGTRGIHFKGRTLHFKQDQISITPYEPGMRHKLLSWLIDPQIAYFLLIAGAAGLFFELTTPGAILPGVLGSISLLLGLYAMSILPSNIAGLLLILFGFILILLEIKITSYGMLSVASLISFFVGSVILFPGDQGFILPISTILITLAGLACLFGLVLYVVGKAQLRKPALGGEALVGVEAEVREWLESSGKIFVRGEIWNAKSSEPLSLVKGDPVKIVKISGLVAYIERIPENT